MTLNVFAKSWVALFLVAWLAATAHAQETHSPDDDVLSESVKRVDSLFREFSDRTPGVAVSVMRDGDVVLNKCYGAQNIQQRKPITSDTVFSLASVSKQFTAFAVLLLESDGKLSLDDDVRSYIPELPDYGTKISLRHLANHTSGLRSHLQMLGMKGLNPNDSITREMVLELVFRQKELNFSPGDEFSYSNSGYSLLAEVVARVSGLTFAEFTKTRILQPLGMNDSYVVEDFNKPVENLATAYNAGNGTYVAIPSNDSVVGSSGLFTNLKDLPKWVKNFSQPIVGNQNVFREMDKLGLLNDGTTSEHGMGQFIGVHQNEAMIFHAGADAGFVAFVVRFPQRNLSVMLLGNCSAINAQQMSLQIADCFLAPSPNGIPEEAETDDARDPVSLKSDDLEKLTGHFFDSKNHIARTISVQDGALVYARPEQGGRESVLVPLSGHEFRLQGASGVTVVFRDVESKRTMEILVGGRSVEHYVEHGFAKPAAAELEPFAGRFYSEELDTQYRVEIEGGTLFAVVPIIGRVKLDAVQVDGFCTQGYPFNYLEFSRSSDGTVRGFRLSSDRAKNIYFEKQTRSARLRK